jgi:hypothetical protein
MRKPDIKFRLELGTARKYHGIIHFFAKSVSNANAAMLTVRTYFTPFRWPLISTNMLCEKFRGKNVNNVCLSNLSIINSTVSTWQQHCLDVRPCDVVINRCIHFCALLWGQSRNDSYSIWRIFLPYFYIAASRVSFFWCLYFVLRKVMKYLIT